MDRRTDGKKTPKIDIEKITPQMHAEICPVCNGFGTLKYGAKTCQACEGKGYVLVPNFLPNDKQ